MSENFKFDRFYLIEDLTITFPKGTVFIEHPHFKNLYTNFTGVEINQKIIKENEKKFKKQV